MRDTRYENGFTLVELLVALMVTSIILTAVATLAFALGTANQSSDDTSRKQAQVRFATLKISDLIRQSKLVCLASEVGVALWRADDSDDNQINVNELTYIDSGAGRDHIRLYQSNSVTNPAITLSEIDAVGSSWWQGYYDSDSFTALVPDCNNVQFITDSAVPDSKFVSLSFDLEENGVSHHYQISSSLRGWAGNLLDDSGEIVSGDDD